MKKLSALLLVMLVIVTPLSFAGSCPDPGAYSNYGKAAGAKLVRGLLNTGLGWVELFRQPAIRENKWEGVGQGIVQTVARTGSGVLEVGTFFLPKVEIPKPEGPACPLDMGKEGSSK